MKINKIIWAAKVISRPDPNIALWLLISYAVVMVATILTV